MNVSGITVTGGTVTGGWEDGNNFSGGLIGECPALLSMNFCSYYGNVTSNGGDILGGLVGIAGANGTTISNSSFGSSSSSNGTLSLKGRNVGGIVGCFSTDKTININSCYVYASSITATSSYVGGVIGKSFGFTKISGCTVNVQANGYISAGADDAGGIIGWLEDDNSSITNSSVKANVKAVRMCGGALGYFSGDNTVTVSNFTFNGSVYSAADSCRAGGVIGHTNGHLVLSDIVVKGGPIVSAKSDAGGLVGYVDDDDCTFTNCVNTANVTASACAGGIVGYCGSGAVSNFSRCINYGKITSSGGSAGGIMGSCNWDGNTYGVVAESANFGNVRGVGNTGGIIGKGCFTATRYSFNTGDVASYTSAKSNSMGGLAGTSTDVLSSYNRGNVSYGNYAGGILGYNGDISYCYNTGNTSGASKGNKVLTAYVNPGTACFYLQGISGTSQGTMKSQAELRADNMPGQLSSTYFCKDTWGINDYYPIHQWWRNNYFYFNISFNGL